MSGRQVALLRGINVGRAKRVAMGDLRALVEELGYGEVRTLLNSGNVVYDAPGVSPAKAAERIEQGIGERLGVTSKVTALTAGELDAVVAENPLAGVADNPSRLFVAFLFDPADRGKLKPLEERDWAPERLAVGTRAAYFWCPEGMSDCRLPEEVGRALGDGVTTRNWATVIRLQALMR